MPQYSRPDADTAVGNFTTQAGSTSNLYATIDETAADDADYIRSPQSPSSEVYVCRLSDVTDPVSSSGHVLRMRTSNDVGAGGETISYTLQLRQSYVNEGSPGTLIATLTRSAVNSTTWTDSSVTLSSGEADSITDYTALFLRLTVDVD